MKETSRTRLLNCSDFDEVKRISKDIYVFSFRGRDYHLCYLSVKPVFEGWCNDKKRLFWGTFAIDDEEEDDCKKEIELIGISSRSFVDDGKIILHQAVRVASSYRNKGMMAIVDKQPDDSLFINAGIPVSKLVNNAEYECSVINKRSEQLVQYGEKKGRICVLDVNCLIVYLDHKDEINSNPSFAIINNSNANIQFHVVDYGEEEKFKEMCRLLFLSKLSSSSSSKEEEDDESERKLFTSKTDIPIIVTDWLPFSLTQSNLELMFHGDGRSIFRHKFYYSTIKSSASDHDDIDRVVSFSYFAPNNIRPPGNLASGAIFAKSDELFQQHFQRIYSDVVNDEINSPFGLILFFNTHCHSIAYQLVTEVYGGKDRISNTDLDLLVGNKNGLVVQYEKLSLNQ